MTAIKKAFETRSVRWIGAVLTLVIGTWLAEAFTPLQIIGPLLRVPGGLLDLALTSVAIPGWGALLLTGFALFGIALTATRLYHLRRSRTPAWLNYTHDEIDGLLWEWRYYGLSLNSNTLLALCPQCKHEVEFEDNSSYRSVPQWRAVCPRCDWTAKSRSEIDSRIAAVKEIERRLRTEEYLTNPALATRRPAGSI